MPRSPRCLREEREADLKVVRAGARQTMKREDHDHGGANTGLGRDTVANISQLQTVGRVSRSKVEAVLRGIDTMLGR